MDKFKSIKRINMNSLYADKGYEKKYWPIINEYFARYQSGFGLTDEEIKEKINIAVQNLDSIEEREFGDTEIGFYYSDTKKIAINGKKMKSFSDKMEIVNVIFHELNHVTEGEWVTKKSNYMHNEKDSVAMEENIYTGTALNEIITEMKASRLAQDRAKQVDSSKHVLKLYEYDDLVFAGSMLHAALGMTETEFLKAAEHGKKGFEEQVQKRFSDLETYERMMGGIEFATDSLYALKYNSDIDKDFTQEDKENMSEYTEIIYENCLLAMGDVMPCQAFMDSDTLNIEDYAKKWRYCLDKVIVNYEQGMNRTGCNIKDPNRHQELLTNIKAKILAVEAIGKTKEKIGQSEYKDLLFKLTITENMTQEGLGEFYAKCGISLDTSIDKIFENTADRTKDREFFEDDYGTKEWNNKTCIRYANKALGINPIKAFTEKIRETAKSKIMSKKIKQLGPAMEATLSSGNRDQEESEKENAFPEQLGKFVIENPEITEIQTDYKTRDRKEQKIDIEI